MKIGSIENGKIIRGETWQGLVFKDDKAFEDKNGICYVPELHDTEYTYNDFLNIASGNEKIAAMLFENVDWQSPEALYNDYINSGEIIECSCGKIYFGYCVEKCVYCGKKNEFEY